MIFDDGHYGDLLSSAGSDLANFGVSSLPAPTMRAIEHRFDDLWTFQRNPHLRYNDPSGTMLSASSEEDPIIITGTTGGGGGASVSGGGGGITTGRNYSPNMPGDGGGGDSADPDCACATLTPTQRLEQNIDAETAKVLQDILQQANQNMEYGSLIWQDSSGVLHHTPLASSPDYHTRFDASSLPMNADGTTDFSVIVGIVHSHPAYLPNSQTGVLEPYFDPNDPDRLLYPSQTHVRDGVTQGDWLVYDQYASLISQDGGNVDNLDFYIIGFDGSQLVINEFGWADRETDTVASGDRVDPNTQACTC